MAQILCSRSRVLLRCSRPKIQVSIGTRRQFQSFPQKRLLTTESTPPTGVNNTFINRVRFWFSSTRVYRLSKNIWFRRGLRTMRVGVLCLTLYQLGRTSGMHDFIRDPNKHTTEFIMGALQSMNAKAVEVCNGGSKTKTHYINFEHRRTALKARSDEMMIVRRIGDRLVSAAHDHVVDHMMFQPIEEDLIGSKIKVSLDQGHHWVDGKLLNITSSKTDQKKFDNINFQVRVNGIKEHITVDRKNIMTEEDEKMDESRRILEKNWTFLLYESPHPNAFVTGLLPNHVFVATSLVNKHVCECDDELAMVMGHELAHTVLDHCHADFDGMVLSTIASTVLISLLDPTGFGSFLYEMFGIGMLSTYAYVLPAKRCHEAEADQLGLIFAAKACFNPEKAIGYLIVWHDIVSLFEFFEKLKTLEAGFKINNEEDEAELQLEESSISKTIRGWSSDHPLTEERIVLLKESIANAMILYENTKSKQIDRSLFSSYFYKK